jgi:predicted nucleic-acid-binding protein
VRLSVSRIAIDTNILVRILVDDQNAEHQCASARALIAEAGSVWVSPTVLAETSWVLESVYLIFQPSDFEGA